MTASLPGAHILTCDCIIIAIQSQQGVVVVCSPDK